MRTLLVGNFGGGNIGDELILTAALAAHPGAVVMTVNPEYSQTFVGHKFDTIPWPPVGIRTMLRHIWQCITNQKPTQIYTQYGINRVVFAGGGLWAGAKGFTPKAYWVWTCIWLWLKYLYPSAAFDFTHL